MSEQRRFPPQVFVAVLIAIMGFIAFFNMASSPRFAAIRSVDVVRLMASGMCFGVAIAVLAMFFSGRRAA